MNFCASNSKFSPIVRGVMRRRVLVNFRVRPEVMEHVLPPPFRPQRVNGWTVGGICMIRLENIRPLWLPISSGINSENAAHRIAVEWDDIHGMHRGVYVPRRDTNSRLNHLVGGRLFPGVHHLADFKCSDDGDSLRVEIRSHEGDSGVVVAGRTGDSVEAGSVFRSLAAASEFFRCGGCGWSPGAVVGSFDGLELRTDRWEISPLETSEVVSNFFQDTKRFPAGTVEFDSTFVMRNITHEWHPLGELPPRHRAIHSSHRHAAFFELP